MFDVDFYLELVNEEYKTALTNPIKETHLQSQKPRIVSKMDEYFAANPLKNGTFNHFRPARYLAENATALKPRLSAKTLDQFENAFKKLNGLLGSD